jgi:hypothetical protein
MTKLSQEECAEQGGHCPESPGAVLTSCKHCGVARIAIPEPAAAGVPA